MFLSSSEKKLLTDSGHDPRMSLCIIEYECPIYFYQWIMETVRTIACYLGAMVMKMSRKVTSLRENHEPDSQFRPEFLQKTKLTAQIIIRKILRSFICTF